MSFTNLVLSSEQRCRDRRYSDEDLMTIDCSRCGQLIDIQHLVKQWDKEFAPNNTSESTEKIESNDDDVIQMMEFIGVQTDESAIKIMRRERRDIVGCHLQYSFVHAQGLFFRVREKNDRCNALPVRMPLYMAAVQHYGLESPRGSSNKAGSTGRGWCRVMAVKRERTVDLIGSPCVQWCVESESSKPKLYYSTLKGWHLVHPYAGDLGLLVKTVQILNGLQHCAIACECLTLCPSMTTAFECRQCRMCVESQSCQ